MKVKITSLKAIYSCECRKLDFHEWEATLDGVGGCGDIMGQFF
jgi:hypothetical protein